MDKEKIEKKIEDICSFLFKKKKDLNTVGVMSGISGEILFFFEYYRYTKNEKYLDHSLSLLEDLVNNLLLKKRIGLSFSNGYSGIGWLVYYIRDVGDIDINVSDIFKTINEPLINWSKTCLKKGNYDFFHGAIGCNQYFNKIEDINIKYKATVSLVNGLKDKSIQTDYNYKWNFYNVKENRVEKGKYNLGLSHGIPSILSTLIDISEDCDLNIDCNDLIKGTLNFVKSNSFDVSYGKNTSFFPHFYSPNSSHNRSRLAWCYGDLGVSCSLWKAGTYLKNQDLLNYTIKTLEYNGLKRDLAKNSIFDAGLCHGSSGVALIYNEFYKKTKNKTFKTAAEYWSNVTLSFAKHKNGIAGFKTFSPNKIPKYYNERGFLEGVSGIGLSLLSQLKEEECEWKEILLIP